MPTPIVSKISLLQTSRLLSGLLKNRSVTNQLCKIKHRYLLLFMLFLSGCQTSSPQEQASIQQQWQQHQQELTKISAFQANGSLAYISDTTKSYGRFLIIQSAPNNYEIKITTPVGSSLVTLITQPGYSELIDKNGKRYADQDVENLMFRLTNINIPLKSLHNWLKGLSDNPTADKLDKSGRLASTEFLQDKGLQQNNRWNLKITHYMTRNYKNSPIDLPATLELTHKDERVRVKIDNWILR